MFVPIFLLGLLVGFEYRYFATRRFSLVFAYGLLPVVFGTVIAYEETAIKILGGNLIVFIVSFLACKFAVPLIQPWLTGHRRRA
jgi:isopentenyl phosphate kinase